MEERLTPPGCWQVDPGRSTVGWSVQHFGVRTVAGTFTAFAGELHDDRASGSVTAASVETDDEQRDLFVRSDEFLDADAFPDLRFQATVATGEPTRLDGDLTIRDTTLPITLAVAHVHATEATVDLRLRGTVCRRAYGLRFRQAMGAADHAVSDEVELDLDLVLVPAR